MIHLNSLNFSKLGMKMKTALNIFYIGLAIFFCAIAYATLA